MDECDSDERDPDRPDSDRPDPDGCDLRLVMVTAPDSDTAVGLARGLVEQRLAACANLVPGVTSVYRWEGELHQDAEVLMLIKTRAEHLPAIEAYLARHHPYQIPECLSLDPASIESRYRAWWSAETQASPRP